MDPVTRPSRHVDEAVASIEEALQHALQHSLSVTAIDRDKCWRCTATGASERNDVGLCDYCFEYLREGSR